MMSSTPVVGSCLCRKVVYQFGNHTGIFQNCHCSRCRKFSGAAYLPNLLVRPADFQWLQGEEFVGRYEVPEARHFATAFCRCCGSSLPWLGKSGRVVVIPTGTLDADPGIRSIQNIHYDSRAEWLDDCDKNALPTHATLPERKHAGDGGAAKAGGNN